MKKILLIIILASILLIASCAKAPQATVQDTAKDTQSVISDSAVNEKVTNVVIKGFAFNPNTITVNVGDKVRWTNEDAATHTIKSELVNSPNIARGGTFEHTFDKAGTYDYICGLHPSMQGRVIVK